MDANCYHLRYVDTRDGLQPPQGAALYNQLNGAPLHAGDKLIMQDGQLLAKVVSTLTDFTEDLTREQCDDILSAAPMLVVCQRNAGGTVSFTRRAYAERQVMTADGVIMSQYLVKAFGEAAWVNKGRLEILFNEWQYQSEKEAGRVI